MTAIQTLGEEYTDIWQHSSYSGAVPPSVSTRAALIIVSLIPSYALGRWGQSQSLIRRHPKIAKWFRWLPSLLEIATEVNLAVFYLRGTYYDLVKRLMGIQHVSFPFFAIIDSTYNVIIIVDFIYSRRPSYSTSFVFIIGNHDWSQTPLSSYQLCPRTESGKGFGKKPR